MLSKFSFPSTSCSRSPPRLHGMQSGMCSTTKELKRPLWSCSGNGRSVKMKSGIVLCERDMLGSPVSGVNPAAFTNPSPWSQGVESSYSVSSIKDWESPWDQPWRMAHPAVTSCQFGEMVPIRTCNLFAFPVS